MMSGVADKRKFVSPIAIYVSTIVFFDKNNDIKADLYQSFKKLEVYNKNLRLICDKPENAFL